MRNDVPYPTCETRSRIAEKLDLPFSEDMQDWEFTVATPSTPRPAISAYSEAETDEERWSLIQLVLAGLEEAEWAERENGGLEVLWEKTESILFNDRDLHRSTVEYWSCPSLPVSDAPFLIARRMRRILAAM